MTLILNANGELIETTTGTRIIDIKNLRARKKMFTDMKQHLQDEIDKVQAQIDEAKALGII